MRGWGGGWGGGGARGTQSAAYTTVPAGKRRHFCLRLNPYTACCSETPFMFAAFHWTQLTFKGYAWAIERPKNDHGCTGERYSRGGKDQMICCVLEGREDRTEPACCQKQVWSKKRKPSSPGGNMGYRNHIAYSKATRTLGWGSSSYPQVDGTGVSEPAPPDCSTAFSPRLWEPWTHITQPLSETPNTPPPPTSQEKTVKLLSLWNSGERACTSHL